MILEYQDWVLSCDNTVEWENWMFLVDYEDLIRFLTGFYVYEWTLFRSSISAASVAINVFVPAEWTNKSSWNWLLIRRSSVIASCLVTFRLLSRTNFNCPPGGRILLWTEVWQRNVPKMMYAICKGDGTISTSWQWIMYGTSTCSRHPC